MADEDSNLTGGSQSSQQSQWNVSQTGDNFQLDFWDNELWDTNSWETSDLDVASSLDDESKQENSEFNIDLWIADVNPDLNWDDSNLDISDNNPNFSEDSDVNDDTFNIDFDTQDDKNESSWNKGESIENIDMNIEDNTQDVSEEAGESSSDKQFDNEVLDSVLEDVRNDWLDDQSLEQSQDEGTIEDSTLLDTENSATENLQESEDILWVENMSEDNIEDDSNKYDLSDTESENNEEGIPNNIENSNNETNLSDNDNLVELDENINLDSSEDIDTTDTTNEWVIAWDENDLVENTVEKIVSEDDNTVLDSDEEKTENIDTNELSDSVEKDTIEKLEGDNVSEKLEDNDVNVDNAWFTGDVEEPLSEIQSNEDEEPKDFTLDFTWTWEEDSNSVEDKNVLLDEENQISDDTSEIDFSDDSENEVEATVNGNSMDNGIGSWNEYLNESIQRENNLLDIAEVDDSNATPVVNEVEDEVNGDTENTSSTDFVDNTQDIEWNAMQEENTELTDNSVGLMDIEPEPVVDENVQQESINDVNENNWFTYNQEENQVMNDIQNGTPMDSVEENESDIQSQWNEAEQDDWLAGSSYNPDVINTDQPEEVVNENVNMQATLSLDEILDSELLTNPQFSDNSKAVPENVQAVSWGLFSNKKILGIFAWVWIFLLAWFVIVLAFPSGNSSRKTNQVVDNTWSAIQQEIEQNLEHSSAPTSWTELEPEFNSRLLDCLPDDPDSCVESGNNEDLGSNSEESSINKNLPQSIVVFPEVDEDEEWYDIWEEEAVPYISTWEGIVEEIHENKSNEVPLDEIKKLISSFKNEAESYYSYWQEVSDNNIIKYSRQIIYLCESYQQKIDNGEWLDEKNVIDFTSQIDEKIAKIETEMNWGTETITTVESFEKDQDYEELKEYIENR